LIALGDLAETSSCHAQRLLAQSLADHAHELSITECCDRVAVLVTAYGAGQPNMRQHRT